jgi:hypothetical protein
MSRNPSAPVVLLSMKRMKAGMLHKLKRSRAITWKPLFFAMNRILETTLRIPNYTASCVAFPLWICRCCAKLMHWQSADADCLTAA